MERQTQQSIFISILLHVAFFGLGVVFFFLQNWLREPEPVVFELVAAAAAPPPRQQSQDLPEEAPLEPLTVPETRPIKPPPEVPDLPEPLPEPPPKPKPEPPPPEPKPRVSYEDWVRNREMPERVQRVQQSRPRPPQDVPEIETNVRDRLEKQLSPIRLQGADISQIESADALQRYLADLRRRIQAAFQPTGSMLQAEAYFTVSASGRLTAARIHQSSGDAAFDRSVLRTLQTARTPGPPPGNRDYTFSLVFRSE
ncbi:MAG: TonB family protein [Oceanipulchritudo sp.]